MANQYLRLNDTNMNIRKAQNLLAIIEDKRKDAIDSKEIQSENKLFAALYKAFKDFFTLLGKPTLKKRFQKSGSPAKSSDYNDTMQEIYNDIHVAYPEVDGLSSIMVKNFNYSEAERQMLLNKVKKLSSNTIDYSFYSAGAKSQSLYGSDSFTDNSKIDISKVTPGSYAAEIATNQGLITLKRLSNIDRSPLVIRVDGIRTEEGEGTGIPDWDHVKLFGGYEGLFYGMKNEPRPEGGKFHVQYSPDGGTLYEMGASVEEKMPIRLKMFDGNPDTFWEVEYIEPSVTSYKNTDITDANYGVQISVADFDKIVSGKNNAPVTVTVGTNNIQLDRETVLTKYVPISAAGALSYLTVHFTVHLSETVKVNWLSLNPNNFGQEKYMDVMKIETSADGSQFDTLEGFGDYEYANVLTKNANEELNPDEVTETMSPDKFKYAGMGVWTFATRDVSVIRFTIRQTRSYIKEYEVLMVETKQSITTTVTTNPSAWDSFWGGKPETTTTTRVVTNQTEIPYLVGQIAGFDVMSLEPGGQSVSTNNGEPSTAAVVTGVIAGALAGAVVAGPVGFVIGGVLGAIFPGLFSSSSQTSTSVGPQTISRQWTVTKNDVSRFAVGIRDIGIYSYSFSESSEFVSKPYISPAPIYKMSVTVDEQIPKIFYTGGVTYKENNWIKYYVSVDDGVSWYRISPMNHRDTPSDDGVNMVPHIINVNSDVSKEDRDNPLAYIDNGSPSYSARFKAVLSRPTDIKDAESYTPTLSSYSLQIYPTGGL